MISSSTSKIIYTCDGSTTVFPYNFYIFADGDLEVILHNIATGSETTLTLGTDYTVSNAGDPSGGNVITTNTYSSAYKLIIKRNVSLTQPLDYTENGPFPAESHERGLDRLTMITQQLQEQLDRAVVQDPTNSNQITFPALESGKYLTNNGSELSWGELTSTDYNGTISRGTDASKPSSPSVGDLYFATDTGKWYGCKTSGTWTQLNFTDSPVLLTGDQTVAGVKTFTSIPVLPSSDPTSDNEATRKKYVDGNLPSIQSAVGTSDASTTLTSYVDMPDMSLSVSVSNNKVKISFSGCFNTSGGGNAARNIRLVRNDGVNDTVLAGARIYMQDWGHIVAFNVVDEPSDGTYTYKVQWKNDSGTLYNRPSTYPDREFRSLNIIKLK